MRTKARTERAKAAIPKVSPVAGRQENTPNTFHIIFSCLKSTSHTSDSTSCLSTEMLVTSAAVEVLWVNAEVLDPSVPQDFTLSGQGEAEKSVLKTNTEGCCFRLGQDALMRAQRGSVRPGSDRKGSVLHPYVEDS